MTSCQITKNIQKGNTLLNKNEVILEKSGSKLSASEIHTIIRQQPNQKTLGVRFKLMVYNAVDSAKIASKRFTKNKKLIEENESNVLKMRRINNRRISKSKRLGRTHYTEKIIPLNDLDHSKKFFREWLKYKYGEKPIVFDTLLYHKSLDQIRIFLKRKGYYYASVKGTLVQKKKKTTVRYSINEGVPYIIDSVYFIGDKSLIASYKAFEKKEKEKNGEHPLIGKTLDMDYLESYREKIAKDMRDRTYYGFIGSSILLLADTSNTSMKVDLGLQFSDRQIPHPSIADSFITKKYKTFYINKVTFHLVDTLSINGPFSKYLAGYGYYDIKDSLDPSFLRTVNCLNYHEIKLNKKDALKRKLQKGALNDYRKVTVCYNGKKPLVKPKLLELQNYLEPTNNYKEYYVERSYQYLNQLNLFSTIKPVLIELPKEKLDVHYYLIPSEKQSFSFEPKFTSSFGLLGSSLSLDYTNRNIFSGGERLMVSLGGGFETQPIVFDDGSRGNRVFNTFEIGPSIKLEVPGLFPVPVEALSKRQKPKTVMVLGYNFETRNIFTRNVFQMNYTWKFLVDKTQVFQIGLPFASVIKYVKIDKSLDFENQINSMNDLFLVNSYSNQFIWEDFKLQFEFNNKNRDFPTKSGRQHKFLHANIAFNSSISLAGNVLSCFKKNQDTLSNGQHAFLGIGYSQFFRNDNQLILSRLFNAKNELASKFMFGFGKPYGNSKTSMPYDYSFFAGGSNDNRGWKARTLGPGSYKYYLDSTRTASQIGDVRIGGSIEYRFTLGPSIKSALFADFGNIWTYKKDSKREGAEFTNLWYTQFALALGTGIRWDLDFFIIRVDVGFPVYNPALSSGSRWIFNSRESYIQEGINYYGLSWQTDEQKRIRAMELLPKPFQPAIHFGIGLPF